MTSRRDALRTLGAFAALPIFGSLGVDDLIDAGFGAHARVGASPRALGAIEHRLVELAAERIIPRTDTPGATDAGVADFVDVILGEWYTLAERDRFVAGLASLDARAQRDHARSFERCATAQQAAIVEVFDREVARLRRTNSRAADAHWFGMLKFLTVWGYYTSRVGMIDELKIELHGGRYDGNAVYAPPASPSDAR